MDKDIIIPGNKIYSPDACCFVPRGLNSVLTDNAAVRGGLPQGVQLHPCGRYEAYVGVDGYRKYLGGFATPSEASSAYNKGKAANLRRMAAEQKNIRVRDGLLRHANLFEAAA